MGTFSGDTCTPPSYCKGNSKTKKVGYEFKLPCSCPSMNNHRRLVAGGGDNSLTRGTCEVQGGTLTATFRAPCNPGCGADPILLELPDECKDEGCGCHNGPPDGATGCCPSDTPNECGVCDDSIVNEGCGCGEGPPGACGCGVPEVDSDGNGILDCNEVTPLGTYKALGGFCLILNFTDII